MIDDNLFARFPKPDVVLGQHVMVGPAGRIGGRTGVITSAADSFQIRMFGRGAHGSMPQASIDPVVMAAATVLRLQTIVSREIAANDAAVVTIGSLQAGTKENVIPSEAIIKLNVRTFDEGVRKRVLAAIKRIVNTEAEASGATKPPEITPLDRYSLVSNDAEATKRVADAFREHFSREHVVTVQPTSASEDFGSFGADWGVPSVFWFVGGTDPDVYAQAKAAGRVHEIPTNHNPRFAPVISSNFADGRRDIACQCEGLAFTRRVDRLKNSDENARAGSRSGRHIRIRTERGNGCSQTSAGYFWNSCRLVCGGDFRRHGTRPANRRSAVRGHR